MVKEEVKIRKVIKYVVSNYELEIPKNDIQVYRLKQILKLLARKYGIIDYNKGLIKEILEENKEVELKTKETLYGNNYFYIEEFVYYEGEDLSKGDKKAIDYELEKTKDMLYEPFKLYIYEETRNIK